HSVDRRVEPARIRVLIERRHEVEFYGLAIGGRDHAPLDARLGRRDGDVTGERAEYRVAHPEHARPHVGFDGSLLNRPREAALEFEIAYDLRLIAFDVGPRGLEPSGDLKEPLGRSRIEGKAQVGIAVWGERTAADQRRA